MKITAVSFGKVDLPLAVQFACRRHEDSKTDVDSGNVATIDSGQESFLGKSQLQEEMADIAQGSDPEVAKCAISGLFIEQISGSRAETVWII